MSVTDTTAPQPTGYLLLFRSTNWAEHANDTEIRQLLGKVNTWFEGLSASGKLVAAQPLMEEGVVVSGRGGSSVTDGPFAEAKEVVGGYVLLSVGSLEEAVEIAKSNPMHEFGLTTEVRVTASTCPHVYRAMNRLAEQVELAPAGVAS